MSVQTVTDMRSLEDAVSDCVCHIFKKFRATGESSSESLCGVPRAEQPRHVVVERDWASAAAATFCSGCGLARCPTCRARARERVS